MQKQRHKRMTMSDNDVKPANLFTFKHNALIFDTKEVEMSPDFVTE